MAETRLISFDLDGTLASGTTFVWQTLHDHFQSDKDERNRLKHAYFAGGISYQQWFEGDIRMLKARGANRAAIMGALGEIELENGARETVDALLAAGHIVTIISGSLNVLVDKLFPDAPFHAVLINEFHFDEAGELADWRHTPYDVERKGDGLRHLAERFNLPLSSTVFIGDNYNDISAARVAGHAIAYNCKSNELAEIADAVVPQGNLRAVLPLIANLG